MRMLLHLSVICTFLSLTSILLYEYTSLFMSSLIDDHLDCFQILAIMDTFAKNTLVQLFLRTYFFHISWVNIEEQNFWVKATTFHSFLCSLSDGELLNAFPIITFIFKIFPNLRSQTMLTHKSWFMTLIKKSKYDLLLLLQLHIAIVRYFLAI